MASSYIFYADAGHGWLRVSKTEIELLQLTHALTHYSHVDANFFYLEEDCDVAVFRNAMRAINQPIDKSQIKRQFSHHSFVNSLPNHEPDLTAAFIAYVHIDDYHLEVAKLHPEYDALQRALNRAAPLFTSSYKVNQITLELEEYFLPDALNLYINHCRAGLSPYKLTLHLPFPALDLPLD